MSLRSLGAMLLFDADCAFCTRSAGVAKRLFRNVDVRPMQAMDLVALGVDPARAAVEIPYVGRDGAVAYGSDAIAQAFIDDGRRTAWLGRLLLSLPFRGVARSIYRFVSRHRHRLPGGTNACELPRGS